MLVHTSVTLPLLSTVAVSPCLPRVDILLTKDRSLTVTLKDSVKFVILLHKVWKKHPYHRDYLGFYTLDTHLLSPSVHGLLGRAPRALVESTAPPHREVEPFDGDDVIVMVSVPPP